MLIIFGNPPAMLERIPGFREPGVEIRERQ